MLVLSLCPGIDLLGLAFKREGFCVVQGGDVIYGGDIRDEHYPPGKFDGVISGPPCQAFSALATLQRANGCQPRFGNLIPEFERCVREAEPEWFLMENVPGAPEPEVPWFEVHSLTLNNRWLGEDQNRVRRFSFGTRDGRKLLPEVAVFESRTFKGAVTSSDGGKAVRMSRYKVPEACVLQGLPATFMDHAPFTVEGKLRAVANGVPIPMGRAIARAVREATAAQ